MPAWVPSAIKAGSDIVNGIFNRKAARKSQDSAQQFAREQDYQSMVYNSAEAEKSRAFTAAQADVDRQLSEKFARESAGWQFSDLMQAADEAGIHRLAAVGGASAASYSPASGASPQASASPSAIGGYDSGAFGGSIIGDGMNAIADFMTTEAARKEEAERYKTERAATDALAASEIDRNSAEAEMYRATARTQIFNAGNRRAGAGANDGTGVVPMQRHLFENYTTPDGSSRNVTVGPDLDEVAAGAGIWTWDKVLDGMQWFYNKTHGLGGGDDGRRTPRDYGGR